MNRHIKRSMELLQNIGAGVNKHARHKVADLEVAFVCEDREYTFTLAQALDTIAEDLYWDERGDWCDALYAKVRVL